MFEPRNSLPSIRFIVVIAVLVVGSWLSYSEAFAARVLQGQISTDNTAGEQSPESDKTGREVGGGQAPRGQKSPKALVEALTRNNENRGTSEPSESQRLDPDRPHLPEASTTAGKGRMILEGGYTFNQGKASSPSAQDAPEALFRAGILTEWFEVRVGQNFLKQGRSLTGIQDLYVGAKVALNGQKRYLPGIALIHK